MGHEVMFTKVVGLPVTKLLERNPLRGTHSFLDLKVKTCGAILLTDISSGDLVFLIFDKRDEFHFHMVNFLALSEDIQLDPAYETVILQLTRYSHTCHKYADFVCISKCAERYPELLSNYSKCPSMICDSVAMALLYYTFPQRKKHHWYQVLYT